MSESTILFAVGLMATAFGAVVSILLGVLVNELRQLRKDIKDCVPDTMCRILMGSHDRRIEMLEDRKAMSSKASNHEN